MVNKVILIGSLGQDPKFSNLNNGKEVGEFSIATNEYWKDKNTGEKQSKTEWHNIKAFNSVGFVKYLKKGSKVYIEGSLQTKKSVDKQGVERYYTSILLNKVELLDKRESDQNINKGNQQQEELLDDSIPF